MATHPKIVIAWETDCFVNMSIIQFISELPSNNRVSR